jgi:hypothetical protein
MCMAKAVVCCPKCKTPQQVTRPDSNHAFWSTDGQTESEEKVSCMEQTLNCRNTGCNEKFKIYWYGK